MENAYNEAYKDCAIKGSKLPKPVAIQQLVGLEDFVDMAKKAVKGITYYQQSRIRTASYAYSAVYRWRNG